MNLQTRFLLIIISITLVCVAGVSFSLIRDLSHFWAKETEQKIQENRINFESRLHQVELMSSTAAKIITANALVSRYFSMSENDRYILLSPSLTRYLDTILYSFPLFQEITLVVDGGLEESRAAWGVPNINEYNNSEMIELARSDPEESFHTFEYHEDFKEYSFNTYRAIELIDRNKSARKKEFKAVVKVSVSVNYLTEVYNQQSVSSKSFIVVHDRLGQVVMKGGAPIPFAIDKWITAEELKKRKVLDESDIIVSDEKLRDSWNLLIGVPSVDAFREINLILVRGVSIQLIFFAFLAVGIFFMLSRFVILPLRDLVSASDLFSKTAKIPIFKYRSDEIGLLQDAFMKMGAKVSRQTRSLEERVYIDGLTGLPNRNALRDLLDLSIRAADIQHKKVAVMFIDLDGFKQVNDVLGHDAGDVLLCHVSKRLSGLLRSGDVLGRLNEAKNNDDIVLDSSQSVVRLGGDEFTVILQGVASHDNVKKVSDKIIRLFHEPFCVDDKQVFVGASIGVAMYPDDSTEPRDLLKYADTAMYSAKNTGKMRMAFFDTEMFNQINARLNIESILHEAFEQEYVWVAYQAKVDPVLRRVVGFEALARLRSPVYGDISPVEFIPLAEQLNVLDNMTRFILKDTCRQIISLHKSVGRWFSVSVNLSSAQLSNSVLCLELCNIVRDENVDTKFVEFELTENSLVDNERLVEENIKLFKRCGFSIALDDFGVGYSSLAHLNKFNFDVLKIDQLFFKNISDDVFNRDILASIFSLAPKLNLKTVAEGIETEEQMRFVLKHDVDMVQGYYFSRPEAGVDLENIIRKIELLDKVQA